MPTLADIAAWTGGTLEGPADLQVRDVRPIEQAGPGDLVFVKDARALARLGERRVGAVLCRPGDDVGSRDCVRVENPRRAAAQVLTRLHPETPPPPGVDPRAAVADGVEIPPDCHVGPFAVIEAGTEIGAGCVISAHVCIAAGARIGAGTWLFPRVVVYSDVEIGRDCRIQAGAVLGSPGFGVEPGSEGPLRFPQRGRVVVGDGVYIGANTTIDRATFDATRIEDGVHIDNLVQVGHNVRLEDGVIVCALTGLAGGSRAERLAVIGPQAALAPSSRLGAGTILGARAALASHQELDDPGAVYMDGPPMPLSDWKRFQVWRIQGRWRGRKGR